MKKSTDKVLPQEHKDSHSKLESRSTSTETAHYSTASPTKQHNFGTGVAEKLHNIFHSHEHHHEHGAHEHHEHVDEHIIQHGAHEHIHEHINAPIIETVVKPTVIEETVRRDKVVEIQPIVHRQVDAPEVHHIEKHVYEKVPPSGPSRIVKQAVIDETIQPRITEEVKTFVHREVPAPYIVHEEQHIKEHLVRPVVHTSEVRKEELTQVTVHQHLVVDDVHTDDWSHQSTDQCPLAQHEKQVDTTSVSLDKKVTFEEKPFISAGGSRIWAKCGVPNQYGEAYSKWYDLC